MAIGETKTKRFSIQTQRKTSRLSGQDNRASGVPRYPFGDVALSHEMQGSRPGRAEVVLSVGHLFDG